MKRLKPKRTFRYYTLKFKRLKGDPAFLARGVAIGAFIGITPTIPLHTITILLFAFLLRGSVVAAILTSIIVSNPLTNVPQYYFSLKVGNMITPYNLSWARFSSIMQLIDNHAGFREIITAFGQLGQEALIVLLLGGCVLAAPIAGVAYFLSYSFFRSLQKKRREKLLSRFTRRPPDAS
ncbi:MAG: hypothetical protein A2511_04380 [Deltaproteobacteria bacterium RIFOXYD12_FULL_50_9]|nr:MAG: hypothetical protein A2511_04380 [Deltaproteobacteria bacterium RIFOXYD12_FULL_50_9]